MLLPYSVRDNLSQKHHCILALATPNISAPSSKSTLVYHQANTTKKNKMVKLFAKVLKIKKVKGVIPLSAAKIDDNSKYSKSEVQKVLFRV